MGSVSKGFKIQRRKSQKTTRIISHSWVIYSWNKAKRISIIIFKLFRTSKIITKIKSNSRKSMVNVSTTSLSGDGEKTSDDKIVSGVKISFKLWLLRTKPRLLML